MTKPVLPLLGAAEADEFCKFIMRELQDDGLPKREFDLAANAIDSMPPEELAFFHALRFHPSLPDYVRFGWESCTIVVRGLALKK
ncbi:hypothetical protein [Mycobacterium sp. ZZG]